MIFIEKLEDLSNRLDHEKAAWLVKGQIIDTKSAINDLIANLKSSYFTDEEKKILINESSEIIELAENEVEKLESGAYLPISGDAKNRLLKAIEAM